MQKRSLPFAIFKWIAVCMQLISCSNRLGIRSNGSSYLLKKKMVSRSNGSSCPCKKKIVICLSGSGYLFNKNCQLFEWLKLSVQKKIVFCWNNSGYPLKKTVSHSNSSGYLFEKNWQPFKS